MASKAKIARSKTSTARTATKARRSTSRSPKKRKSAPKRTHKWSAGVTKHSDALDLKESTFKAGSAKKIAALLKASAEHSRRRKAGPFQSAMSMLNFYINRAGKNLTARQRHRLELAKGELRRQFNRA